MTPQPLDHAAIRRRVLHALADRPQKWLADASGIPPTTLSEQIHGKRGFTLDLLWSISQALDRDIGWLIRGDLEPAIGREEAARAFGVVVELVDRARAGR